MQLVHGIDVIWLRRRLQRLAACGIADPPFKLAGSHFREGMQDRGLVEVFLDPDRLDRIDDRYDYGEERRQAIGEIDGWHIDEASKRDIDAVLTRCIPNPVSPEFMAPPMHAPRPQTVSLGK